MYGTSEGILLLAVASGQVIGKGQGEMNCINTKNIGLKMNVLSKEKKEKQNDY